MSNPSSNASRTQLKKARPIVAGCAIAITIFVCIIAISLIWVGLVIIGPEERGVVISALDPKGYRSALLQPGPHWIIPLLEHAQVYSIAPQTYTMAANMNFGDLQVDDPVVASTKDGQSVSIDVSVIYAVDPAKVIELHATWQDRYQDQLVRPLTRGTTRAIVLQYSAAELVGSQRSQIGQMILTQLEQEFSNNYLLLKDFTIQDIRLGGS